jgi:hypothetical protein
MKYYNHIDTMVTVKQFNGLQISGVLKSHNVNGDFNAPESIDLLTKREGHIRGKKNGHSFTDYVMQRVYVQNIKTSNIEKPTEAVLKDLDNGRKIKEAKNPVKKVHELQD